MILYVERVNKYLVNGIKYLHDYSTNSTALIIYYSIASYRN